MVQPPRNLLATAWSTASFTPFSVPPPIDASPPLVGRSLATVTAPVHPERSVADELPPPPPVLLELLEGPHAASAASDSIPITGIILCCVRSIGSPGGWSHSITRGTVVKG